MALQRFYAATDKLMNAFIMGEIIHGMACSCAVGNIVGAGWNAYHSFGESSLFYCKAVQQISESGYSPFEIYRVERRFENRGYSLIGDENDNYERSLKIDLNSLNDSDGFKGLCNVFDYLVTIEDWNEEEKGANIFQLLESVNN